FISIKSLGCQDTSVADTFIFYSSPVKPKLLKNKDTIYVSNVYSKYQWYKDGLLIPADTFYQKVYTQNGKYFVKVSNQWGCEANSDTLDAKLSSALSSTLTEVLLYPNPASTTLKIEMPGLDQMDEFSIYLYSTQGTLLEEKTFQGNSGNLDINNLIPGMYLIHVKSEQFQGYYYFLHL
ncbi:MAG: T9SS type A sorting domain-containing protein, partial [Bacteroidetes bacterium]|nr:T9SS type A sorting domain-containing protein [Bacteroidota bacterium]